LTCAAEWKLRRQPICAGCSPRWKPTNAPCAFARTSWEAHLAGAPAANWEEAAEKARYVLGLYAATLTAEDTRRRTLVAAVLEDLERLASAPSPD
jgi:hypothetical protein